MPLECNINIAVKALSGWRLRTKYLAEKYYFPGEKIAFSSLMQPGEHNFFTSFTQPMGSNIFGAQYIIPMVWQMGESCMLLGQVRLLWLPLGTPCPNDVYQIFRIFYPPPSPGHCHISWYPPSFLDVIFGCTPSLSTRAKQAC